MRGLGVLRPESSHVASQPGADPSPLAEAISPRLVPGRNRLRDVFLDEAEAAMFPNWERATAAPVASFRTPSAPRPTILGWLSSSASCP